MVSNMRLGLQIHVQRFLRFDIGLNIALGKSLPIPLSAPGDHDPRLLHHTRDLVRARQLCLGPVTLTAESAMTLGPLEDEATPGNSTVEPLRLDSQAAETGSDASDAASEWSGTDDSEQEPFETYQAKIHKLCCEVWPELPEECFKVDYIKGGMHNRIVGITIPKGTANGAIPHDPSSSTERFIFRIPRWESGVCARNVFLLRYLSSRMSYAVPRVESFDASTSNALENSYILQHPVAGLRLDDIWSQLSHQQRCLVALDVARLYRELTTVRSGSHGIPIANQGAGDEHTGQMKIVEKPFWNEPSTPARYPPMSGVDALCHRLKRWEQCWPAPEDRQTFTKAIAAVRGLEKASSILGSSVDGSQHYLCHGDLLPRNIMVVAPQGTDIAYISGILDWDDAHFAPPVIALTPPAWLWLSTFFDRKPGEEGFIDDLDLSGPIGSVEPEEEECREIKRLFDSVAGDDITRHMYAEHAPFLRRVWYMAHQEMGGDFIESDIREQVAQLDKDGFLAMAAPSKTELQISEGVD